MTAVGLAVTPKGDLGVSSRGATVHRIEAVSAVLVDGRLRYRALWLCGNAAADAVLLASADGHGGAVCPTCLLGAAGIFVYRCYAAGSRLLYVGFTAQLGVRLAGHKRTSSWWPQVSDVTREQFPSLPAARAAERLAIQSERPLCNRQWATP